MTGVRLPENLSSRPEIKSMWYELNRHIVIMNDMVSLKKEMVSTTPLTTLIQLTTTLQSPTSQAFQSRERWMAICPSP